MTDTGQGKENIPTDPAAAALSADHSKPLDVDGAEKDELDTSSHGESSGRRGSEKGDSEPLKIYGATDDLEISEPNSPTSPQAEYSDNEKRPQIAHTKSYATTNSGMTRSDSNVTTPPVVNKPWYKQPNPLRWGGIPPVPEVREVSREYTASFFSLVYFQWIAPIMAAGYKRQLEQNDIYTVNPNRSTERMTSKLKESFKKRVARGDKYPLFMAMHETFKFEFWLGGACQFT